MCLSRIFLYAVKTKMSYPIRRLLCSVAGVLMSVNVWADMADINRIYRDTPTLNSLEICYAGGCAKTSRTQLNADAWQKIADVFNPPSDSAEQERARIATAIGLFEQLVGAQTGTDGDRAGTFKNADYPGQMDCNDEAINSTTYMRLLKQHGLMPYHEIEDTRTRNFFFNGWPHTTAVIRDIHTQIRYAVDSWFHDNGHAAEVVVFEVWKDGWRPSDTLAQ